MLWSWIIVFVGIAPWLSLGGMILLTSRRIRLLSEQPCGEHPLVSVVCPARNEADELESAMQSRLADSSPRLEFILVDDRSSDATGSIMDALARADDRVRVVHNDQLPEGWLGKVNAQQRGLELAHGDWILFSDSDVHLRPGLVSSAMAWAEEQRADHVALIPRIEGGPFIMRACLSIMILVLTAGTRLWKANDDSADRAMGVGAFNLVRRSALEAAGGLEKIRMEIADDVGIGTIIRESGARSRLALATDRLSVKWYRSSRDFLEGMEKGAAKAGGRFGLALRAVLLFFTTLVLLAPFVVLAFWAVIPLPVALVACAGSAIAFITSIVAALRFGLPWRWSLLLPLGLLLMLFVGQRSLWLAFVRGGVRWRGDQLSLESTQEGEQVRI